MIRTTERYEIKYPLPPIGLATALHIIKTHPAGFRQSFPPRRIQNIYFDSLDLSAYQANLAGISRRSKYRLRWYGEDLSLPSQNAVFEVKEKNNALGWKIQQPMQQKSLAKLIAEVSSKLLPSGLFPKLYNSYNRYYFISANSQIRCTLDEQLIFSRYRNKLPLLPDATDSSLVLELKYDPDQITYARQIGQHMSVRPSRFSKYVRGIELVYA